VETEGLTGFLPGQKVKDGGNLNTGLRKSSQFKKPFKFPINDFDVVDQNFALQWVQKHVRAVLASSILNISVLMHN
jgi:hypothetical protein